MSVKLNTVCGTKLRYSSCFWGTYNVGGETRPTEHKNMRQ